jgi:DNA-binding transcriptional MerR regulator
MRTAKSFSTAQVSRLTSLSTRQLDYWDRQGFASPSLASAAGYGSSRRYSFFDLVCLRVAGRLRAAGFGLKKIRQCVETLRRLDPEGAGLASARLLLLGSRVVWARSEKELVDMLMEGQLMLVFPLGQEVRSVSAAIGRLAREKCLDPFVASEAAVLPVKSGRRR